MGTWMGRSRIRGIFGSEEGMEDLKISQFDIGERRGHQEMQEGMMSRDTKYVETSLACSATDSVTCSVLS